MGNVVSTGSSKKDLANLRETLKHAETQIASRDEELKLHVQELAAAKSESTKTSEEAHSLRLKVEDLDHRLHSALDEHESTATKLESELKDARNELMQSRHASELLLQSLTKERDDLRAQTTHLDKMLRALEQRYRQLELDIVSKKRSLTDAVEDRYNVERALKAEVARCQLAISDLEASNEKLRMDGQTVQITLAKELEDSKRKSSVLEREYDEYKKESDGTLAGTSSSLDLVKVENAKVVAELVELKKSLAESEGKAQAVTDAHLLVVRTHEQETAALRMASTEATEALDRLKIEHDGEMLKLKSLAYGASDQVAGLEAQSHAMKAKQQETESKLDEIRKQHAELQSKSSLADTDKTSLETKLQEALANLEKLQHAKGPATEAAKEQEITAKHTDHVDDKIDSPLQDVSPPSRGLESSSSILFSADTWHEHRPKLSIED